MVVDEQASIEKSMEEMNKRFGDELDKISRIFESYNKDLEPSGKELVEMAGKGLCSFFNTPYNGIGEADLIWKEDNRYSINVLTDKGAMYLHPHEFIFYLNAFSEN